MIVERSKPINSLPARGRGGVSQRMRCAAAAGRQCNACRGPRSGREGPALNSPFACFIIRVPRHCCKIVGSANYDFNGKEGQLLEASFNSTAFAGRP